MDKRRHAELAVRVRFLLEPGGIISNSQRSSITCSVLKKYLAAYGLQLYGPTCGSTISMQI